MKFIDLDTQYKQIQNDVKKSIELVLDSGQYILGKDVQLLENKLAKLVKRKYCISCSSGTDALLMCLMGWDIGPKDIVFTTPFTYISTSEVIRLVGATPVFVDIDPNTFNIDPLKLESTIEKYSKINDSNLKAIIPVNIFGLCSNYKEIDKIAKKYNLYVLEDAAQSFGAEYYGEPSGSFGDASATSFFPSKPLGCYGDGGAIFTDNEMFYEKLLSIRVHGSGNNKYENVINGINGRLDTIQAAILNQKLKIFEVEKKLRTKIAEYYNYNLKNHFKTQYVPVNYFSIYAQFSFLIDSSRRNILIEKLKKQNIPSMIYYNIPLHLQKVNSDLGYKEGDLPVVEKVCSKILSIPMHPYIKKNEMDTIISIIKSII